MRWVLLFGSVLVNVVSSVLLLEFTLFSWPPPNVIPRPGAVHYVLVLSGLALGVAAFAAFRRYAGSWRIVCLLPTICVGFSIICLWLMWEYPRAYERHIRDTGAKLKAASQKSLEDYLRESGQQPSP